MLEQNNLRGPILTHFFGKTTNSFNLLAMLESWKIKPMHEGRVWVEIGGLKKHDLT